MEKRKVTERGEGGQLGDWDNGRYSASIALTMVLNEIKDIYIRIKYKYIMHCPQTEAEDNI